MAETGMNGSALARLPPELRNRIYAFALTHTINLSDDIDRIDFEAPLTLTCRQVRRESLQLGYHHLRIVYGTAPRRSPSHWLNRMGAQHAAQIQRIGHMSVHRERLQEVKDEWSNNPSTMIEIREGMSKDEFPFSQLNAWTGETWRALRVLGVDLKAVKMVNEDGDCR